VRCPPVSTHACRCRFKGPGLLIVQSHQPPRFGPNGRLEGGAGARQGGGAGGSALVVALSMIMFFMLAILFLFLFKIDREN
jgi:hypothetical protein